MRQRRTDVDTRGQSQALGERGWLDVVDRRIDDGSEVHVPDLQPKFAGDDPGDFEQVFNQPRLCVRVALDAGETAFARRFVGAGRSQDTGPAEHRVHWRAQFMRQRRQELVFQAIGFPLAFQRGDAVALDPLAFVDFPLQLGIGLRQFRRSIRDVVEHLVEGANDSADFVARQRIDANRVVTACGHPARGVRQVQEWFRDRSLHPMREGERCRDGQEQETDDGRAADHQASMDIAQVSRQIEHAGFLTVVGDISHHLIGIPSERVTRRWRRRTTWLAVAREPAKELSLEVVDAGMPDVRSNL